MRIHLFYGSVLLAVGTLFAVAIGDDRSFVCDAAVVVWCISAFGVAGALFGPAHVRAIIACLARLPLPRRMSGPVMLGLAVLLVIGAAVADLIGQDFSRYDAVELPLRLVVAPAFIIATIYVVSVSLARTFIRRLANRLGIE